MSNENIAEMIPSEPFEVTQPVENSIVSEEPIKEETPVTTSMTTETDGPVVAATLVPIEATDSSLAHVVGGSQVRKYLNAHVSPYLIKGMKQIATEQPQDPLKVLGEYLIEQSNKLKGETN